MSNQIQNVKEKKNYTYKKLLNKYFELEVKKKENSLEEPIDTKIE